MKNPFPDSLVGPGKDLIHFEETFPIKKARDGIRTRDPRLGKAILHH